MHLCQRQLIFKHFLLIQALVFTLLTNISVILEAGFKNCQNLQRTPKHLRCMNASQKV